MMYTCMIADDEPLAHEVLLDYIERTGMLSLVKQVYTAHEARLFLDHNTVDLLFLDIEMPGESGLSLLASLQQKPVTILTTAYLKYSLEGYELGVMDYLVKPVRFERFEMAVKRAIGFIDLLKLKSDNINVVNDVILIKSGNSRKKVQRSELTHAQAFRDYVVLYTAGEKFMVRSTMREMEDVLGRQFTRVHKSFIVAKRFLPSYAANKITIPGSEIPVGRNYKNVVLKQRG